MHGKKLIIHCELKKVLPYVMIFQFVFHDLDNGYYGYISVPGFYIRLSTKIANNNLYMSVIC